MKGMTHRVPATGHSMLPAIFPGAELLLSWSDMGRISAGAIVCYLGEQRNVVAHRVVRVEAEGDRITLLTRGDAQQISKRVPLGAVSSTVQEVRYGVFRYRTAGPLGRAFAHMALGEGVHWEMIQKLSRYAARLVICRMRRREAVSCTVVRGR